jgi:predicted RecA/RadA family phage recombinase
MATNEVFHDGRELYVAVASGVVSGAPVLSGGLLGVALFDRDGSNSATIDRGGSYKLSVKGVNDAGNAAVAVGDAIYYLDADTPKLSKKASGRFFGIALATITSGSTATINVLQLAGLGAGLADAGQHLLTVDTNGTTAVAVLGATIPFGMKILSIFAISLDTTAGNITTAFGTAGSVNVIAKGTVAGVTVGGVTIANSVAAAGDALTVVSSSAGNARVHILYEITT